MTDETYDKAGGAKKPGSTEQVVHDSAGTLGLGLGLTIGGTVVLLVVGVLRFVPNATAYGFFMFFGGIAVVVGVIQTVIGVYQLAQNIDRMAKAVLKRQRD
ncbi:hypothetical protein GCM10010413_16200 [Promicromonospora sukumoe]|uniref:Uncharacterized protein n=1 Tax=Promicromonospora sukumoe TaxID=88382 RepID=A0A7W3PF27_9MICO|nr:hypothetical protein [Promicromonospora sukumoe]MBA8809159.1 hypothetical protein [Promicromonospora sukumoe]